MRKPGSFAKKVYDKLKLVPKGRVTTYGLLAKAIGHPAAARAVGNALNNNPDAPAVPCHRVIRSDGAVGNYRFGANKKMKILRSEGVVIDKAKIKDMTKRLYKF